ncbi:MAG: LuxR C-terminal-related transcriptional regulator [Rhodospirillales bacterium]|nr:LuxR C-terminal-related transcriptional regulator [Rhodospirillales bacterium]
MSQQDEFERIVGLLNEAMLDDARWLEASALIDEALGSKGNHLVFSNQSWNEDIDVFFVRFCYRGEHHTALEREYFQTYYPVDDHLPGLRRLPDGEIAHVRDTFVEQDLANSVMYNEAMPRFGFQNGLNVRMDGPFQSRIIFGIADPIGASDWSSGQLDLVKRLLPHIRQFVRMRLALIESGGLGTTLSQILENAGTGVIQLDRRGRIVAANDSARALLRDSDGLSNRDGALRAATPEDNDTLQKLLAQALPRFGEQGASGSMMVRRPSLLPRLILHVKPVANREVDYRSQHLGALVLIVDPVERVRIDPGLVAAALGLTPTETEIAVLLAEGRTAPEIAEATGRGYSTVRTHLKHIYLKLGVSRQFEVAQLVLALSNLPVSRD